ncbi:hypothetical protein PT974_08366 [Cladobotryum mycophilum]|uniref:Uncharacterized protein n=1 Tax=Cladobotryum mycophilum TaxID=491253 RepID=A0ABR0SD50_9HYPO
MSNRSLISTLRSLGRLNGLLVRPAVRQFSTSPVHGVRAIFAETDNAELNTILTTIQEKIILPAYLPEKQRKMVFDPKMKSHLEQNPVIIEVEGLEHKFSSIDRFKGVENSKGILNRALHSMQSQEDWANLGTLLAGYRKAGIRLKADHWGKIVRMAGKSGNIYAVIECAKQADKTGLRFINGESVVRVLSFVNGKVTDSNFGVDETTQALKWAELVLDLLQRPDHAIEGLPTRERLHFSRVVRGMTLFTRASAFKVKQQAGESIEQDLVLLEDDAAEFASLNPTVERNSTPKGAKITKALNGSAYVKVIAQGIKGIALAREILGETAQGLAPVEVALSNHLKEFVQTSKSPTTGWDQEYQKIVGHAPQW